MLKLAISDNIRVMEIIKEKKINLLLIGLLAVVFFIATASFNYQSQDKDYVKWSSPDETANYFFAKKFSTTGQLAFFDPANVIGDNMVMPRSVRTDSGWIKPVSFLGIILIYGSLAAVFGLAIIPFLTPFFAAVGLILFYLIVRRIFGNRVGLWSAFILALFPVYIYYTTRSMFHNILFIFLLLAAVYLFILALGPKRDKADRPFVAWTLKRHLWLEFLATFGSGLFAGLALITRTSELLWLAPAWFLIWLFYARRLGATKLIIFFSGLFLALVPVAYYNQILYGSFWHGGYNEMNRSIDDIVNTGGNLLRFTWTGQFGYYYHYLSQIFHNIFYFGFNYSQSLEMSRRYIWEMFSVLSVAGLSGWLLLAVKYCRQRKKKYLVYLLSGLIVSAFLIFYYGSWKFNDNPDLTRFTIGNSYTRYWLPIYLWLIPLSSLALVRVSRAILLIGPETVSRIRKIIATGLQFSAVLVFAYLSLNFVLFGSEEGLVYLYYNNQSERANTEMVWAMTEPAAVIITRYHDKFFWPERRVIMGVVSNDEILTAAAKLSKHYPVYYYNFYLNDADVVYLNERKLSSYKLKLRLVRKTSAKFGLYKIERLSE